MECKYVITLCTILYIILLFIKNIYVYINWQQLKIWHLILKPFKISQHICNIIYKIKE